MSWLIKKTSILMKNWYHVSDNTSKITTYPPVTRRGIKMCYAMKRRREQPRGTWPLDPWQSKVNRRKTKHFKPSGYWFAYVWPWMFPKHNIIITNMPSIDKSQTQPTPPNFSRCNMSCLFNKSEKNCFCLGTFILHQKYSLRINKNVKRPCHFFRSFFFLSFLLENPNISIFHAPLLL